MNAAAVAWLVAAVSGLGCALLVLVALRRLHPWRYLFAGLVLVVGLVPYRFDGEHLAPAFTVAVFRTVFEANADPGPPWRLLAAAVVGLVAVFLGAVSVAWLVRAAARRLRRKADGRGDASGAPKRVK